MGYTPPLPNSARLIDWGHSWVAPPQNATGSSNLTFQSVGEPSQGEQWSFALRDALGIGSSGSYYRSYAVPAVAAATATTFFALDVIDRKSTRLNSSH